MLYGPSYLEHRLKLFGDNEVKYYLKSNKIADLPYEYIQVLFNYCVNKQKTDFIRDFLHLKIIPLQLRTEGMINATVLGNIDILTLLVCNQAELRQIISQIHGAYYKQAVRIAYERHKSVRINCLIIASKRNNPAISRFLLNNLKDWINCFDDSINNRMKQLLETCKCSSALDESLLLAHQQLFEVLRALNIAVLNGSKEVILEFLEYPNLMRLFKFHFPRHYICPVELIDLYHRAIVCADCLPHFLPIEIAKEVLQHSFSIVDEYNWHTIFDRCATIDRLPQTWTPSMAMQQTQDIRIFKEQSDTLIKRQASNLGPI